ncbi:Fungal Zn(2)-Cys(6) binuclear cluster domain [Ceratobasidium sp. AG-Ba]|nr:Fungal Zn(2)-Cys(6) binuclear cluster domain [Ceratobasidium sp. AG-Ba]
MSYYIDFFRTEPTGPLTSLREYTVASQLADSRSGSPQPEQCTEEGYDDPVSLGLIPEDNVIRLFYSFHTMLNPVLALLDPALHTPHYVRRRSKVLYTAILAASCKFFNPGLYKRVHDLAQRLIGRALADGICTIEYIQALSIISYWREPDDGSCWRKIGLAIRMAYELNLHLVSEDMMPLDELAARERLNQERTWFRCLGYDWNSALQRGKPRMISENHFPKDARQWLNGHAGIESDADLLLVVSIELAPHYNLYQSLRSATTDRNRNHLAPFIRHTIREGERLNEMWAPEKVDPTISHISRSFIQFYNLRMRLITSELKLLVTTPIPGASHLALLDCANAALAIVKHVTEEFAPHGYLSYGQDFIPFSTAYAGAWLFKQHPRMDDQLRTATLDTFRRLSETCRAQTRFDRDTTSYYSRFFDHLVNFLTPTQNGAGGVGNGQMFSGPTGIGARGGLGGTGFVPGGNIQTNMNAMLPSSLPPLEDMDATWVLAANGFDNLGLEGTMNLGLTMGSVPFSARLN